jgi:acetyl-CoA carboxylase biotin carboxyl carrier protein
MSHSKDSDDTINPLLVRQLADILKDTELTEIEVEQGGLKIRVARQLTQGTPVTAYAAPVAPAPPAMTAASAPSAPAVSSNAIKSPMVGTVYLQAQPGNPPFIAVGDTVKEGQTLLIIEAMKTMNSIPSPKAGKVVEILVHDSQPVEFGAPLVVIE